MDPSSSITRKGSSYWTKRRQIRENTEQQMSEVRVCLQKKRKTAESDAVITKILIIAKGLSNKRAESKRDF